MRGGVCDGEDWEPVGGDWELFGGDWELFGAGDWELSGAGDWELFRGSGFPGLGGAEALSVAARSRCSLFLLTSCCNVASRAS